ncbi:hypothetical protein N431DRAFT_430780 [Stipitochalara longipes BDJ]|nr:hypothetical protein N431DRAFT_430780 [Stipitochalara longipes BDJ]
MPLNVNGLDAQPQYNKLYDNFFKCLYNIQPDFVSKPSDPEAREYILDAHKLVEAATYLEAVPAVRATVEANLLRLNIVLWKHLEFRPESWVHLAARLQSPLIFREAIIHIVGKFHLRGGIDEELLMDKEGKHGELGRQIWDLIVKKARELKDKKLRVERRLVEFYPSRMLHMETDNSIPGRAIYSEDIYFWQALTLVRQFIASAYMANFHHRASDAGITFYRNLFSGSYLRPETLGSFYECFAMTLKGKQRLLQVLEMIKGDLKPIIRELLVNRSKGDRGPDAPTLDHLTCIEILEEEYPWIVPAVEMNGDTEMSGAL